MLKIASLISLFLYVWSAQSWFWIHWENNYALSQQGANGPVWICPKWTGAAYWSGRKGFLWAKEGETHITKEHIQHTLEPRVVSSLSILEFFIIFTSFDRDLSHHHQPRRTIPLETSFFNNRSSFGNTISLHFANLSANINTSLFKFSPVWVEFTSSRVHLNINVEAAYVMVCRVFCLGASSHLCSSQKGLIFQAMEELPSLKALCLQMLVSHF